MQFAAVCARAKMKFLLLLVLIPACVWAQHEHDDHGRKWYLIRSHNDLVIYRQVCAEKVHASAELVEQYKAWRFPDDSVTRCYLECVFEKFGFYNAEDGFDVEKVLVQLSGAGSTLEHNDETRKKAFSCAETYSKEGDSCSRAYLAGMCFMDANLRLVQQSVQVPA